MTTGTTGNDAYLDAFMNGFEFVLLAMQGRLSEGNVPEDERGRIDAFLEDYRRIARAYRSRTEAPAPEGKLPIHGVFKGDVAQATTN